jgi:DNA-binding response OmpR family regulator
MTARLLIVDDDPEITSALARGLALHDYEAQTENQAARALEHLTNQQFDGAIIDVMLGADSGIDLVRRARARGATLPILMLSALSDVEHRTAGLEAGADDYVVKPFSFEELVARLRVQQRRQSKLWLDPEARSLHSGETVVTFTEREFELLSLLVAHAERPVPRVEIFESLWASEGSSNENVVDVYVGYLRKKLAGHDFGFEIKTVRNKGFCFSGRLPLPAKG